MKKEKTLKLNLSSVLAMITVLLTFFISAAIAKQMTSANAASDTDWNMTTTSWTQEYEYTTVPHSYTESDATHTRWETENNGSTTSNYSDETSSQTSTTGIWNDSIKVSGFYSFRTPVWDVVIITKVDTSISGDIIIPSTLGGYPVTEIGDSAFSNCTNLTSITIPDSVTSIGFSAFSGCTNLERITFGEDSQLTSIGYRSFGDCTSLLEINIPKSVETIGAWAFNGCSKLKKITGNCLISKVGNYAFEDTEYYNNTENWENGALYILNVLIKARNVPEDFGIRSGTICIGASAFEECTPLKNITIPKSVKNINMCAFGYNSDVFGAYKCEFTDNLVGVIFEENSQLKSIGECAFACCTKLESITIPDGVTDIANHAISYCTSLKNITIPNSVINIGNGAFYNCSSLESMAIPDNVESLGAGALLRCSNLKKITVGAKNQHYSADEYGALFNKDKTELIQYPAGNTRTSYIIPDSVTSISSMFDKCTNITSITVDSNNKNYSSDEYGVLFNKDKTELIQYPAGNSRTSYSIPDSVMSIVYDAFYGCTSLEDIYYSGTDEEWNEIISDGIPNIKIHFGNEAPTEPTTKPAVRLEINSPSTKSINYGDSIVLHADIEWTHPDGAKMIKVVWSVDNGNFSYSVSPDGLSCTISPESSGETVFTATVYDMDGNEISSDTVQMTAKASIWHKIIAFFKKLLSLNEIIPYAMKNLYKK